MKGQRVLGYVVGHTYHDAYSHQDFEVVGATDDGRVTVRDLSTFLARSHRTPASKFTIERGTCRTNGCASGPAR